MTSMRGGWYVCTIDRGREVLIVRLLARVRLAAEMGESAIGETSCLSGAGDDECRGVDDGTYAELERKRRLTTGGVDERRCGLV